MKSCVNVPEGDCRAYARRISRKPSGILHATDPPPFQPQTDSSIPSLSLSLLRDAESVPSPHFFRSSPDWNMEVPWLARECCTTARYEVPRLLAIDLRGGFRACMQASCMELSGGAGSPRARPPGRRAGAAQLWLKLPLHALAPSCGPEPAGGRAGEKVWAARSAFSTARICVQCVALPYVELSYSHVRTRIRAAVAGCSCTRGRHHSICLAS